MKKKITAKEIAKLSNVSQSAVSRAFSPNAPIGKEVRAKILKIAEEHGFRPNAMAGALITRKSKIIALVMAYLENMFYPAVLDLFSRMLRAEGYHILLFISDETGNVDSLYQEILSYQVDGIILASTTLSSKLSEECARLNIPVVMFNRTTKRSRSSGLVVTDNFEGARTVAHFLCRGPHRRIAYIAGPEFSSTGRERNAGFEKGMEENEREIYRKANGNYDFSMAQDAARSIFQKDSDENPDAVFVANDHTCLAVMNVLKVEYGLKIPEEVSLVGFDKVPVSGWPMFDLTTFEQPYREMVRLAVRTILDQIQSDSIIPQKIVLKGRLVVRSSAKLPEGWKKTEPEDEWAIPDSIGENN